MANRYWVRPTASGNGNWNDTANWSATSGGASGASVPGTADAARFDNAGGTLNANCDIDINVDVGGIDMQSTYSGTLTQTGANTLRCRVNLGTTSFNLDGGAFVGGSATITIDDTLIIGAGKTFTSTSGTLDVARTITMMGTFTHNNGKVKFTSTINTVISQAIAFYDMEIAKGSSSAGVNVVDSITATVANAFTMTSGVLGTSTAYQGTLTANGSISIAAAFSGTISSTCCILNIAGAGDQSFTVPNGAKMPRFELNQASTTITFADGSKCNGSITYTSGTILLANGGTITWGGASNWYLKENGGTLTVTGSSLVFVGRTIFVDMVTSPIQVNNLEINMDTGYSVQVQDLGEVLQVDGTLTLTNGKLALNSASEGFVDAKGSVSVAATFDGTAYGTGTTLRINGTVDQSFTVPVGGKLPSFILNSSLTTITYPDGSLIMGNVTVQSGTLVFNGTVTIDPQTLTNLTFKVNGGTWTHSSGTLVLNSTAGTDIIFDFTSTTIVIDNLTCNMVGGSRQFRLFAGSVLQVNGTLTLTDGKFGGASVSTNGDVYAKGSVSIASTFDGQYTYTAYGSIHINGSSDQSFSVPTGAKLPSIVLNQSSTTITMQNGSTITGNVTVTAGTFTYAANATVNCLANGGTTRITFDINGGTYTHNNSILNATWPLQFDSDITIGGLIATANVHTASGKTTIVTLDCSITGLIYTGTLELRSDFILASSGGTGILKFAGGNSQEFTSDGTSPNGLVEIDKSGGELTCLSNMTFDYTGQDLTITAGVLDLAGYNLTVNGTFTMASGTELKLKGSETVTIGSRSLNSAAKVRYYDGGVTAVMSNFGTTFPSLTFGASKTHNFAAGGNYTVSGTLASDGTSGTRSILRSTSTGTQWNINLSGTSTLADKVDVKDSNASSGSVIFARKSLNSGNNLNWSFGIFKCWTGSAWIETTTKRWTGSAWVDVVMKRWTGAAWVTV